MKRVKRMKGIEQLVEWNAPPIDVLEAIDKQLTPFKLQVVQVATGGDEFVWRIEPRRREPTERERIDRREKARARHWRRTGVSEATVRWMKDNGML